MSRVLKAGTTNHSTTIRIVDSTDGTPETGVTSATAGLALEYRREGAVSTAITESDLSALTDAHSDGGMLHIGNGYYRLDLPDAAVAAGAAGVLIHGTATGMVVIGEYYELVAYDPTDTVRLGLTALPNAAADAAGGLPISDAGGLDLDTMNTNVSDILTDTGTTLPATLATAAALATVDTNVDSILVDTGTTLPAVLGTPAGADLATDIAAVKTQTAAIETDTQDIQGRLPAALVSGRMSSDMVAISGDTAAADKLEESATSIISSTLTSVTDSTTLVDTALTALTGGDDVLIGRTIIMTSGNAVYEAARITDYEDSTGTLTVTEMAVLPSTDTYVIV